MVAAVILALGILFAPDIPSLDGAGAAWTSFLPWTAVPIVLLGAAAVIRRSWWAGSAVIIAAMVWSITFVPQLMPTRNAASADILVATQNIGAANPDPAVAIRGLLGTGAGLVAAQEITSAADGAISQLDAAYADHVRVTTVGHNSLPIHGRVVHEICTILSHLEPDGSTHAEGDSY